MPVCTNVAFGGYAEVKFILPALLAATPDAPDPQTAPPSLPPAASQTTPAPAPAPAPPSPPAQGRAAENAVTQAEDGFGFSVGRETLGIYSQANVRGFSPFAAGNVRIEGLYFDPYASLLTRLRRSTAIKVGLSAQGYPFPSPTGIVDFRFRKPGEAFALSAMAGGDTYGNASIEADAVVPVGDTLSLGLGGQVQRYHFVDGVKSWTYNKAAALRWRPSDAVEVIPFYQRSHLIDDEAPPIYIPAGAQLPPRIERRRYAGPGWTDLESVGVLQGALANVAPASDWLIRAGLFRSLLDEPSAFAHLLLDVTPDGAADRLIIADPHSRFISTSGEFRVTRSLTEGDRLHVVHLSLRGRDRSQRYGGSSFHFYGPTVIGEAFDAAEPDYAFTEQTRDGVRQWTGGIAYEGRWRDVGELSFGVSRTDYRKRFELPGMAAVETRADPWLYNVTAAAYLGKRLTVYAGHARGLEESGIAPANAVNRNQPLPAILTRQIDAGFRYQLSDGLRAVGGVFDLRKPYNNLDAGGRFGPLGDIVSRGVELSLAGTVTPNLYIVAGGVLSRPRVTGAAVELGRVGERPVGISGRLIDFNADWRVKAVAGLSLDLRVAHSGDVPATTSNLVEIPSRTLVDLGARYRFKLGERSATVRGQVRNVGDAYGFDLRGAGAYAPISGRTGSLYLTVDF